MEKIELPEKTNKESNLDTNIKSKFSGLSRWIFGVTKFILGILLLPLVYAVSVSFFKELGFVDKALQDYFWSGVISLVIVHLLIWEPAIIYAKGHKILEVVFSYFKPLVRVAPYLLPIYAIVLFTLYTILSNIIKSPDLLNYFVFLFGLSISLHLIFSAKTLRSKKDDFLKGNYIFGFSFVYIINIMILAFFLNLILDKFSFVNFSNQSFQITKGVIKVAFKQLFL